MTMYSEDNKNSFHALGRNTVDDFDTAKWWYFDNLEECLAQAEHELKLFDRKVFLWRAEKGVYVNQGGTKVQDWLYRWWYPEDSDAGYLPGKGYGVPEAKSWDYRVTYRSLDPAMKP